MKFLFILPILLLLSGCNDTKKKIDVITKQENIILKEDVQKKDTEQNQSKPQTSQKEELYDGKVFSTSSETLESKVSKEEWETIQKENLEQERMMKEIEEKEKDTKK